MTNASVCRKMSIKRELKWAFFDRLKVCIINIKTLHKTAFLTFIECLKIILDSS